VFALEFIAQEFAIARMTAELEYKQKKDVTAA